MEMNEVIKVSIAGIAFTFDREAYMIVKEYLDKLEAGYARKPDGREIVADIEARMAELILNEQESERIVGVGLARSVVEQLGFPDDMDEEGEPPLEKIPKRLHRNPEGAILGGVCSGLGAYFRVDPVWIRLAFFLPLLLLIAGGIFFPHDRYASNFFGSLFGTFIILYIILWIAVPLARTPRQKLEMRGERVTASSIHQTFSDDASAMSASPKRQRSASVWADIMYALGRIFMFALKAVILLIALALGIATIAVLAGIVILIFYEEALGGRMILDAFSGMQGITPAVYAALIVLAVLIPIMILGYFLLKILFGSKTNKTFVLISCIIWVILIVYLSVVTAYNASNIREGAHRIGYEIEYGNGVRRGIEILSPGHTDWEGDDLEDFLDYRDGENVHVEIKEDGDRLIIDKVSLDENTPGDTLSRERIVIREKRD